MLRLHVCRLRRLASAVVAASVLTVVGCGGDGDVERVPVYPATGVIRLDGEPFGPCVVELVPAGKEAARTVTGTADGQGKITFGTYEIADGAAAGSYKVVVRSSLSAPPPSPIPPKYGSDMTTPLTASVRESGPNEIAIDMESAGRSGSGTGDAFTEAFHSDAFNAGATQESAPPASE